MPPFESTHVEIYVFRRRGKRVEFLCLRRSPGRSLEGVWQPVTGKRKRGERPLTAAIRETIEEIGAIPRRWWTLETVSVYFDPIGEAVRVLPLFAAEIDAKSRIELSGEHDAYRFLTAAAAGKLYLWEAQRRGLQAVRNEVLRGGALAKALAVETRPTRPKPGPKPRRTSWRAPARST